MKYIWGEGKGVENTNDVQYIPHKDIKHNNCPLHKNEAWLMRHCWKHREETEKVREIYFKLYAFPFPKFWIALAGQWYRLVDKCKVYSV